MENGYPTREQVKTGLELGESLGSPQVRRFRQMLAMHDELERRQEKYNKAKRLINRMATVIGDAWEDVRSYEGVNEMLDDAESMTKEEQP